MARLQLTVGQLFDRAAQINPDGDALVEAGGGGRASWRQVHQKAETLAAGLVSLGVGKGEHVTLWSGNSPDFVMAQMALAKAGAVMATMDTGAGAEQLEYQLKQSDSATLILTPGMAGSEFLDAFGTLCPDWDGEHSCAKAPKLKRVILMAETAPTGMLTWDGVMEAGAAAGTEALKQREAAISPDDPATLLYTSGTTGAPKGVLSSHLGLVNVSEASAQNMGAGPKDRFLVSVPLYHMFGSVCVVLAAVASASALVFPQKALDPASTLEAAAGEKASVIFGSPNFFLAMMEQPAYGKLDVSSLRTGIMGGASCPIELMRKVVEGMGVGHILVGYGQTEASSWATQTRPDDPLELRVSTVGRALGGAELMIADPVSGAKVEPGEIGEFRVRGFNMIGYYKMPQATTGALDEAGWLHTGDLATMDAQGNVRIVGRVKEVINKNGRAVYPLTIEEAAFSHPKVANVAAFSVPDPAAGEEVALWVRLKAGEKLAAGELAQYLAGKIPDSHQPAYIEFVEDFPMTAVGKMQKFKMREAFVAAHGLKEN